jgi:hypothetical protein
MEHTRKFVLLPSDASRLGAFPNVHAVHGDALSAGMGNILDNKQMPDDRKLWYYQQQQQNFMAHKQYMDQPIKFSLEGGEGDAGQPQAQAPAPAAAIGVDKPQEVLHSVVNFFQGSQLQQRKAEALARFLNTVDRLGWTTRGEITVNGRVVPNSNLTVLMNDVMSYKNSSHPAGSVEFSELLKASGVPHKLVSERSGFYRPTYRIGSGEASTAAIQTPSKPAEGSSSSQLDLLATPGPSTSSGYPGRVDTARRHLDVDDYKIAGTSGATSSETSGETIAGEVKRGRKKRGADEHKGQGRKSINKKAKKVCCWVRY